MSIQPMIFILYSCNQWKEHGSMRFLAASTEIKDIHKLVRAEIREGNMNYKGLSKRTGSKCFGADFQNNDIDLNLLEYGYITINENLACKNQSRHQKPKRD